jgi:hypothetical protein
MVERIVLVRKHVAEDKLSVLKPDQQSDEGDDYEVKKYEEKYGNMLERFKSKKLTEDSNTRDPA